MAAAQHSIFDLIALAAILAIAVRWLTAKRRLDARRGQAGDLDPERQVAVRERAPAIVEELLVAEPRWTATPLTTRDFDLVSSDPALRDAVPSTELAVPAPAAAAARATRKAERAKIPAVARAPLARLPPLPTSRPLPPLPASRPLPRQHPVAKRDAGKEHIARWHS